MNTTSTLGRFFLSCPGWNSSSWAFISAKSALLPGKRLPETESILFLTAWFLWYAESRRLNNWTALSAKKIREVWVAFEVMLKLSRKLFTAFFKNVKLLFPTLCDLSTMIPKSIPFLQGSSKWQRQNVYIFNNYSSSPNGLGVNSPWGRRPNGLLTRMPWGRQE